MQNIVIGLAMVLDNLLSLYFWILLAAVILSWVNPDPGNPIVRFLRAVTDPVLWQVRRRLPFVYAGGLDFSPIVVLLAIRFLQVAIVRSLYELAARMAWVHLPGGVGLG